jgi:hypothetical protein
MLMKIGNHCGDCPNGSGVVLFQKSSTQHNEISSCI